MQLTHSPQDALILTLNLKISVIQNALVANELNGSVNQYVRHIKSFPNIKSESDKQMAKGKWVACLWIRTATVASYCA